MSLRQTDCYSEDLSAEEFDPEIGFQDSSIDLTAEKQ